MKLIISTHFIVLLIDPLAPPPVAKKAITNKLYELLTGTDYKRQLIQRVFGHQKEERDCLLSISKLLLLSLIDSRKIRSII